MAELFAFNVAVLEPEPAAAPDLGYYDPQLQQFVWAGDDEVTLGAALCSRGPAGYNRCSSTGTACNMSGSGCQSPGFPNCYIRCDYG
ncbi:hypothetical protein ABT297_31275 [Dactylosporangium sp. NPDC000555]|uniref:hypothetical protein n=1 Tax=Dactylosporangium sp. NPDC000555 TaxID=3154260 RepID=UPI0033239105